MNVSYSGPLWHVAVVEPRGEHTVADAIGEELGYATFLPVERSVRVVRGRRVVVSRPLFTGYVFAGVDPYRHDWQRLLDIDGIVDVLGRPSGDTGMRPSYVPVAWIEGMRRAEAAGVFDRTRANASKFRVGDTVRVSDGPFSGFNAIVQEFTAKLRSATARKRAKLLVAFMNRMVAIEMDVTELEKA